MASSRDRVAGRTEHNKLGLFTGWEDASLAKEGIAEAKRAGQLLRAHGFAVDAVYTSWLSRAIETAWLALQELDALWVPIIKSWRLNERMYGALTGLSKKAILGEHGAASAYKLNFSTSRRWLFVVTWESARRATPSFHAQVRPGSSSGAAATRRGHRLLLHLVPHILEMTSATSVI